MVGVREDKVKTSVNRDTCRRWLPCIVNVFFVLWWSPHRAYNHIIAARTSDGDSSSKS